MTLQETIERIHDIPILDIVSKHIQLKRAGKSYKANCPFPDHTEKTPSFHVDPGKNICWCFGCNKGGDAISFIRHLKGYNRPIDAILDIAREYNIPVPSKKEYTEDDVKEYQEKEQFKLMYTEAADFYRDNVKNHKEADDYINARIKNKAFQDKFQVGFAPDGWHNLETHLTSKGYKKHKLIESRLLSESNNNVFDMFRSRIMFPIHNQYGNVIALAGRYFFPLPPPSKNKNLKNGENKNEPPKYINSPETKIYSKKHTLYGLHLAKEAIIKKGGVYVVEGYTDVIKMHSIGVENTVAPCGTALTSEQVTLISKFSNSIVLLYDGDEAGSKEVHRSAEIIISQGLNCNILPLPVEYDEKGNRIKFDPDSFFTDNQHFKEYKKENIKDYLLYKSELIRDEVKNFPDRKAKVIRDITNLILKYDDKVRRELYIDQLSKVIEPKKLWQDTLKELTKEHEEKVKKSIIPKDVSLEDFERYGFYNDHNCYYFKTRSGPSQGSNFILIPLFHIESVINSKRLFEIKNEFEHTRVIELQAKDLVTLSRFKERVESLGNYIWYGSETDLNRLKGYIYEKTKTCKEIEQMGWQSKGFWAWANGVYNGSYKKVDEYGIVEHDETFYYIPAFSVIYKNEDGLFVSERKFVHTDNDVTFFDITKKVMSVYGEKASIGICFYIACLFRDFLVKKFNFFPIMNLFGPKGAGKTEMAVTLLQFFGHIPKGPNINSTSKAALADHVANVSNAIVHIDEYKNNLEYEKIEFLKGLWDGTGRTRMNMDKDKKKETTAVDSGIMLTGQEMPTADIALFSRLIFVAFHQVEFSDEEKERFNDLKRIEKKGLTHITEQLLNHREHFRKNFDNHYNKSAEDLKKELGSTIIEDRIFKNWLILIASYSCISDLIDVSFTYNDIIKYAAEMINEQNSETKRSNEISIFWSMVEFLRSESLIEDGTDFKVEGITNLKTSKFKNGTEWKDPKTVLTINHSRILPLYRKHGLQQKENVLPRKTLEYYLQNSPAYMGKMDSCSFKVRDEDGNEKRRITTAYCFEYEQLNIDLVYSQKEGSELAEKEDGELPF